MRKLPGILILFLGFGACSIEPARSEEAPSLKELLPRIPPRAPAEALKSFEVAEGFALELVASEPQVTDPIAIAFDENGRIYVAEMRDYPYPPEEGKTPFGRVHLLEDKDADGFYETSHPFVDPLPWPTGVACWKGGVFVASAPHLFYFKDTDGDGVADLREIVYSGFGTAHVYATLNNLKWSLDNHFYGTSSYNGGHILPGEGAGREPTSVGGRDFRFEPNTWTFEAVSGTSEFGNSFDDWGNRFVCNAGTLMIHPVLPDWYLARNPYLPVGGVMEYPFGGSRKRVFPIHSPEPWRVVRRDQWSRWVDSSHDMRANRFPDEELAPSGYVTAAAGVTIYRGSAYPEKYRGAAFTGETAQNVVVAMGLSPKGVGFSAERLTGEKEFIASTDNWFRPVNFENGPDGCLYLVDMYREIIEDPSAIPEDIQAYLDMTSGRDHGRIYRIIPDGFNHPEPPSLGKLEAAGLVAELLSPDSWRRDTAQRLLIERQDSTAVEPLMEVVRYATTPQSRLHALYTLDGLGQLSPEGVRAALDDPFPEVREHALKLGERWLNTNSSLSERSLTLLGDPALRVRFQLAFSLGYWEDPRAMEALAIIAQRDGDKDWFEPAILSSVSNNPLGFLEALTNTLPATSEVATVYSRRMGSLIGSKKDPEEVSRLLQWIADRADPSNEGLRLACLSGFSEALGKGAVFRLTDSSGLDALRKMLEDDSTAVVAEVTRLAVLLQVTDSSQVQEALRNLVRVASDENRPIKERTGAISSLGELRLSSSAPELARLVSSIHPSEVQIAAVRSLSVLDHPQIGSLMLENWTEFTPKVRSEVLEALFARRDRLPALLDALERGQVLPQALDSLQRHLLLNDPDAGLAVRAKTLIEETSPDDEKKWEEYRSVLELPRNLENGKAVFETHCAKCHQLRGIGTHVGPDLSSVNNKPDETLLRDILFPSGAIVPGYANYLVETIDGRTLTGVLAAETATSLTLREEEGKETTLLRGDLANLRGLALSAMPQDQEKNMSREDLADLLGFLRDAMGPLQSSVVTLFEDDPSILECLDQGSGQASLVGDGVFSGTAALAVAPPQRYSPRIPGWDFKIAENPTAGEFRYFQFAWRTEGEGVMLELADEGAWPPAGEPVRRYFSGKNLTNWEATEVDSSAPQGWTVVTRDLWRDFGSFTLTGIAPTAMGGTGLFDRIRLARTLEELVGEN